MQRVFVRALWLYIILTLPTYIKYYPASPPTGLTEINEKVSHFFLFRRVKSFSNLIDLEAAEKLISSRINKIKVVVLDMDGTLTESPDQPVDLELINLIIELSQRGYHVAIVSGASEVRIQRLLFDHFPDDFQGYKNIHVYSHAGAYGFPLRKNGDIDVDNPYFMLKFTEQEQKVIDNVIDEFLKKFGYDVEKVVKYESKRHIRLRKDRKRTRKQVQEYVRFIKNELNKRGETKMVVTYGEGLWGMDISITNKANAIKDLISQRVSMIKEENIMVIADSFSGETGDDRAMAIPGILAFNVGAHEDVPENVYSLKIKGPKGTKKLLMMLKNLTH